MPDDTNDLTTLLVGFFLGALCACFWVLVWVVLL